MENVKYVVLLYKYDVVEVGDLFVILHIYNKILSYKKNRTGYGMDDTSQGKNLFLNAVSGIREPQSGVASSFYKAQNHKILF